MKADVCTKYGPPDVLQMQQVAGPVPTDDEVQEKISAASMNPLDWHSMRGKPFTERLAADLIEPFK